MPTYIMLGRLTAQAKQNMTEAIRKRDELWAKFQSKGVKVTQYQTLGNYDVVNIVEAPSDDVLLQFLMAAGATGNIESTTLRAFSAQEMEKLRGG